MGTNTEKKVYFKTTEEFLEVYGNALQEYLNLHFKKNQVHHIEDLAVNAASFSEAFYITIGSLY